MKPQPTGSESLHVIPVNDRRPSSMAGEHHPAAGHKGKALSVKDKGRLPGNSSASIPLPSTGISTPPNPSSGGKSNKSASPVSKGAMAKPAAQPTAAPKERSIGRHNWARVARRLNLVCRLLKVLQDPRGQRVRLTMEEEAKATEVFYQEGINSVVQVQRALADLGQNVLSDEIECLLGMFGVVAGHYIQLSHFCAVLRFLKQRRFLQGFELPEETSRAHEYYSSFNKVRDGLIHVSYLRRTLKDLGMDPESLPIPREGVEKLTYDEFAKMLASQTCEKELSVDGFRETFEELVHRCEREWGETPESALTPAMSLRSDDSSKLFPGVAPSRSKAAGLTVQESKQRRLKLTRINPNERLNDVMNYLEDFLKVAEDQDPLSLAPTSSQPVQLREFVKQIQQTVIDETVNTLPQKQKKNASAARFATSPKARDHLDAAYGFPAAPGQPRRPTLTVTSHFDRVANNDNAATPHAAGLTISPRAGPGGGIVISSESASPLSNDGSKNGGPSKQRRSSRRYSRTSGSQENEPEPSSSPLQPPLQPMLDPSLSPDQKRANSPLPVTVPNAARLSLANSSVRHESIVSTSTTTAMLGPDKPLVHFTSISSGEDWAERSKAPKPLDAASDGGGDDTSPTMLRDPYVRRATHRMNRNASSVSSLGRPKTAPVQRSIELRGYEPPPTFLTIVPPNPVLPDPGVPFYSWFFEKLPTEEEEQKMKIQKEKEEKEKEENAAKNKAAAAGRRVFGKNLPARPATAAPTTGSSWSANRTVL